MTIQKNKTRRVFQPPQLSPHENWASSMFLPDDILLLHIGVNRQQLTIRPKKKISIGRREEEMRHRPDIDFVPFEGEEHGVSRLHAVFTVNYNRITITDLGSRNGTWLNGKKLEANQPSLIRAGDDIQFGTLLVYIYFIKDNNRYSSENERKT